MGGGISKHDAGSIGRSEAEIVNLMMPIYYVDQEVTIDDIAHAKIGWQMIINDTAPMFVQLKGTENFHYRSSLPTHGNISLKIWRKILPTYDRIE